MYLPSSFRMFTRAAVSLFLLSCVGAVRAMSGVSPDMVAQKSAQFVSEVRKYGRSLTHSEAMSMEQALETQPDDLVLREKLIGYYFYQGIHLEGKATTIRARRRHIEWLIRNCPDSRLAGMPEATIDPAGHPLADKDGYETASAMWRALVADESVSYQVLKNAFYFLRLNDKPEAESIAVKSADPYLLGELYAMGALRITLMNQNGFVLAVGASHSDDAYAFHAVKALRATDDKMVIDAAAAFLLTRGIMVQAMSRGTGRALEPQPVEFAAELLERCDKCQSQRLYKEIKGMMKTPPD